MKKLAILLAVVSLGLGGSLSGCGTSSEEVWGGYTEGEAKDLLKDDQFRIEILQTAPPTAAGTAERLYPTDEEIDDADLRKATVQGDEAWEYKREVDLETQWCIYVSVDPADETKFLAQVGPCFPG
jgi:hypothetical protein